MNVKHRRIDDGCVNYSWHFEMGDRTFDFVSLGAGDLPVVRAWLEAPHVRRWWNEAWTSQVFAALDGGGPLPDWIEPYRVDHDGRPIGYIQAYWALRDPSGFWEGVEGVTTGTRGIDFLIGEADCVNRKLGRAMIRAFAAKLFADPDVDRIVADPQRDNWPCNIALKRAGFRDRGRIDRPGVNAMLLTLARGVFKPRDRFSDGPRAGP